MALRRMLISLALTPKTVRAQSLRAFATSNEKDEPQQNETIKAFRDGRIKMPSDTEEIHELKERMNRMEEQMNCMKEQMKRVTNLYLHWCARDLTKCAGEIWKWVVQKKGHSSSSGRHLSDPYVQGLVQKAAIGMRMTNDIDGIKEMCRVCIVAKNDLVHFNNVKQLDDLVRCCEDGMAMFPQLALSHPNQWRTVEKYWSFKQVLQESFKDN